MRKMIQKEFEALPVVDGYRQCPGNIDYSEIGIFGAYCNFGANSSFGAYCTFGERCSFGEGSSFGAYSRFGAYCSFGANSSFGADCSFGEGSSFDEGCSFEGQKNIIGYYAVDRIGSREAKTYFFYTKEKDIYVRCGCWFSTIKEFRKRVEQTHKDNPLYLKQYLLAINFIEEIVKSH